MVRNAFGAVPFTLGAAVPAAVGASTGLVVVSALNFWLPLPGPELTFSTLALMAVSVFSLSALWEAAWRRQFAAKRRVLVVGTSGWAQRPRGRAPRTRPTSRSGSSASSTTRPRRRHTACRCSARSPTSRRSSRRSVPTSIVLTEGNSSGRRSSPLLDVASSGFKVVGVTHFFEHVFGRVPIRHLTSAWFMSILHLRQRTYTPLREAGLRRRRRLRSACCSRRRCSRSSCCWCAEHPGPVSTARCASARAASSSRCYKFRTMGVDAEAPGVAAFAEERRPAGHALRPRSSGGRTSTSCRSSGTCSRARCRSSARARSGRSSSPCSRRRFRSGRAGCWSSRASRAGPSCAAATRPTPRARPTSSPTTSGTCATATSRRPRDLREDVFRLALPSGTLSAGGSPQ